MYNKFSHGPLMNAAEGGEGGGSGEPKPAPSFDFASLRTELTGIVKSVLGESLKAQPAPTPTPAHKTEPEPEPEPKPGSQPDALAAQLAKAQRDFAELNKQLAAQREALANSEKQRQSAEEKRLEAEKSSALKSAIAAAGVRADGHDELAVIMGSQITRSEDGELVGPGNVALATYIKEYVEKRPAWLPPLPGAGAGATQSARNQQKPIDINDIKPGMSPEDKARAMAQIATVLRG